MKFCRNLLLMCALVLLLGVPVYAKENKTVVALGADLSEEQRATVLSLMDLTEEDLKDCIVITVTNEEEHRYLGNYIDSSIIGSKSLSSVKLIPKKKGNGVLVTIKNINYCTTGMYRNALLTAGLEDTDVLVVGPSEISGTAALIGAVKGYGEMSGVTVDENVLDVALDELITTGQIAEASEHREEIEELMAYVKAKLAAGELETEEDILEAIQEGETKFGVTLTEEQKQQILAVMEKIDKLGLDPEKLLDQAKDLYEKFGEEVVDKATDAVKKSVTDSIGDFFSEMVDEVVNFFKNLFS